jgi:hypothetical protein
MQTKRRGPRLPYASPPLHGIAKTNCVPATWIGLNNTRSTTYWHLRELLAPASGAELTLPPERVNEFSARRCATAGDYAVRVTTLLAYKWSLSEQMSDRCSDLRGSGAVSIGQAVD